jgi:hypothetical protein
MCIALFRIHSQTYKSKDRRCEGMRTTAYCTQVDFAFSELRQSFFVYQRLELRLHQQMERFNMRCANLANGPNLVIGETSIRLIDLEEF